jgi:flagellin-like hook-associated protein FlgL
VVVSAIKSHADKAVDLVLQGRNDTLASEDRMLIATALRNVQEALLKDLNSQVAGRYLMGGANTKEVPFRVHKGLEEAGDPDASKLGHLLFNGENVFEVGIDDMPDSRAGFTTVSQGDFESLDIKAYVDLTGEFQFHEGSEGDRIEDALVDKSTVFDMFTPGVNVIGVGPNNLYNLIGRIILAFESEHKMEDIYITQFQPEHSDADENGYVRLPHRVNIGVSLMGDIDGPVNGLEHLLERIDDLTDRINDPNTSAAERAVAMDQIEALQLEYDLYSEAYIGGDGLFQRLQEAQLNALISLVNVGERSNFVSYLKERNEEYVYQAEVLQNKLEGIPADEAIMKFRMQDFTYKACLQMGSYIFQPSLMDFINR